MKDDDTRFLGGLGPAEFLERHWQKQPRLIRGALRDWRSPLTPEELAGLACEENVESRLVLEHEGQLPWEVRHGPFTASDFSALPDTHWTLLVQGVDRLIPEVAALLERFRFVPNWRLDDVMVSYAVPGGGVGPHLDNYDAFLLQDRGRRRWSIGRDPLPPGEEQLVPGTSLRILARFDPASSWVLEPGDMLYLPPRVPHLGVAIEPCMTYSIGFRAPTCHELLASWWAHTVESLGDGPRYSDPDLALPANPGEIDGAALARVARLLRRLSADEDSLADWFGSFVTRDDGEEPIEAPEPSWLVAAIRGGARLERVAIPALAYVTRADGRVRLFAGGRLHALGPELAFAGPMVCGTEVLALPTLGPHLDRPGFVELLCELIARGSLELST